MGKNLMYKLPEEVEISKNLLFNTYVGDNPKEIALGIIKNCKEVVPEWALMISEGIISKDKPRIRNRILWYDKPVPEWFYKDQLKLTGAIIQPLKEWRGIK